MQIIKWWNLDEGGMVDGGEEFLGGWDSLVEGPGGFSERVTTDNSGSALLAGLAPGQYTITEFLQAGWHNTTPNPLSVEVVEGETAVGWFGNVPEPSSLSLIAVAAMFVIRRRRR